MRTAIACLLLTSHLAFGEGNSVSIAPGTVTQHADTFKDNFDANGCTPETVPSDEHNQVITSGTVFHRTKAPDDDDSCYMSVYGQGYHGFPELSSATMFLRVFYVGFLWGSIDPYNSVSFNIADGQAIGFSGYGTTITGQQIIDQLGVTPYSDVFVEFKFDGPTPRNGHGPVYMRFMSSNYAFEIDNLAYGITDEFGPDPFSRSEANGNPARVPEPEIASGLFVTLSLGAAIRWQTKKKVTAAQV